MRKIVLLRHAHAEPARAGQTDIERPLSTGGLAEAEAAGRWLREQSLVPDAVLCSTATRARQTLDGVRRALALPEARFSADLYEAMPGELIRQLDTVAEAGCVLLIGHNPGLEELLPLFTDGRSGDHRGMPTAAIAAIAFETDEGLEPGAGRVLAFWSPSGRIRRAT